MKINFQSKSALAILFAFLSSGSLMAQNTSGSASSSYLTNSLFLTLAFIIILLLIVIVVLSFSIRNGADYLQSMIKKGSNKVGMIILLLCSTQMLQAQNHTVSKSTIGGIDYTTFYLMLILILIELILIYILGNILSRMFGIAVDAKDAGIKVNEDKRSLSDVFNASVEVEREAEILLDHEYDGIRELDNNLPPWWKYGFYLTIIWAVIYIFHYHLGRSGDLQEAEFNKEVAAAEAQIAEFRKKSANNVDESNVKMITGAAEMENAKKIYLDNCAACHGRAGEGGVGPNMADEYWLHGGSLQDVFKSIKYGWPDKGMKAWNEDLSPNQIALLSSYIRSIVGSNPANAKAPQGDLYKESGPENDSLNVMAPDSLKTISDSLKQKPDTLKN
jgi:cytochrome c oxidase cbb3-type subunit 3